MYFKVSQNFNLTNVISEVTGLLESPSSKQIIITRESNITQAVISADRQSIKNALLNLGLNAKDSIEGEGKISFSTELKEVDEDYC